VFRRQPIRHRGDLEAAGCGATELFRYNALGADHKSRAAAADPHERRPERRYDSPTEGFVAVRNAHRGGAVYARATRLAVRSIHRVLIEEESPLDLNPSASRRRSARSSGAVSVYCCTTRARARQVDRKLQAVSGAQTGQIRAAIGLQRESLVVMRGLRAATDTNTWFVAGARPAQLVATQGMYESTSDGSVGWPESCRRSSCEYLSAVRGRFVTSFSLWTGRCLTPAREPEHLCPRRKAACRRPDMQVPILPCAPLVGRKGPMGGC